ncbi:tetratricopeptide repeat protein [bacterium]|nr:tetratricopeptide repeat protein [bacterium]
MVKYVIQTLLLCSLCACSGNKSQVEKSANAGPSVDDLYETAMLLHDAGQYDSSLQTINLIYQTDTQNFKAKLLEGDVNWALRNMKASMAAYLACLRWQPKNPLIWTRLGKAYLEQKDYETALKYFNQAIAFNQSYADAYIGRAVVYASKNNMEQALLSMQTAIDFAPDNLNAMLKMAEWQLADSNEMAIQYYNNAVMIDSSLAEHYFLRARAHEKFNHFEEARSDYEKAISMSPETMQYHFSLAYLYFQYADFKEALNEFSNCINLNESDADAWLGRALCEKELGLKAEARYSLEKMLEINPDDADALRELENLQ